MKIDNKKSNVKIGKFATDINYILSLTAHGAAKNFKKFKDKTWYGSIPYQFVDDYKELKKIIYSFDFIMETNQDYAKPLLKTTHAYDVMLRVLRNELIKERDKIYIIEKIKMFDDNYWCNKDFPFGNYSSHKLPKYSCSKGTILNSFLNSIVLNTKTKKKTIDKIIELFSDDLPYDVMRHLLSNKHIKCDLIEKNIKNEKYHASLLLNCNLLKKHRNYIVDKTKNTSILLKATTENLNEKRLAGIDAISSYCLPMDLYFKKVKK